MTLEDKKKATFIYICVDEMVKRLIKVRNEHRKNGEFGKADEIRDFLDSVGIVLEDTKPTGE